MQPVWLGSATHLATALSPSTGLRAAVPRHDRSKVSGCSRPRLCRHHTALRGPQGWPPCHGTTHQLCQSHPPLSLPPRSITARGVDFVRVRAIAAPPLAFSATRELGFRRFRGTDAGRAESSLKRRTYLSGIPRPPGHPLPHSAARCCAHSPFLSESQSRWLLACLSGSTITSCCRAVCR